MKKQLWQVLFEFLSIVFAVLLALGLNSYKQNMDLKEESQILTQKILMECDKNLAKLDSVVVQNKELKQYLDSMAQIEDPQGFSFNFSNELLSSSAWTFTHGSKAFQLMDQAFLDDATELYEIQSYYMEISNQMFDNLGQMLMKIDEVKPGTFILTSNYYLTNILNSAEELQNQYKDFLSKYNSN